MITMPMNGARNFGFSATRPNTALGSYRTRNRSRNAPIKPPERGKVVVSAVRRYGVEGFSARLKGPHDRHVISALHYSPMRLSTLLTVTVTLLGAPLAGQGQRLSGPPLVERHSHVRDGALIGAAVGGFAGGIAGLADQKLLCPSRVMVCRTPGGAVLSMIGGIAVGGAAGGIAGAVIGAFIHSSGTRTDVGLSVRL